MKNRLKETEEEVPYFSGGKLILSTGQNYPDAMGGNCVVENKHLASLLRDDGYLPRHISVATGRVHYATLCVEKGRLYYLDPFLLHSEPIDLTKAFRSKRALTYDASPIIEGNPSKVVVQATGNSCFTVSLFGYRHGEYAHVRTYRYDLFDQTNELPDLQDPNLAKMRQQFIALRVMDAEGVVSKISLFTDTGLFNFLRFNGDSVFLKQRKEPEAILREVEKVSQQLRLSLWKLLNYMHHANGIYHNLER